MRHRLSISYLGTRFAGWQIQAGPQPTVQGELRKALSDLFGAEVVPHGAGRTDSGVHADGQVAHFDLPPDGPAIPPLGVHKALNARLPEDIRVTSAAHALETWHARFDARGKRYVYRLRRGLFLPPHAGLIEALAHERLNLVPMREAAALFLGTHDFGPFSITGSPVRTTERTVWRSEVLERGQVLEFVFEGDGFLRGMVRRLVGTLRDVGRGRIRPGQVWDRPGPTVEARGLTLEEVFYDPDPEGSLATPEAGSGSSYNPPASGRRE